MNPIGGEVPVLSNEKLFFTDSGRSSLKLFIRSKNKNKKFLIPNYFCEVIEKVLLEEKVKYEFYNINDDLSVDIDSVKRKKFDILYVINYFGKVQNLKKLKLDKKIVLEDNVFFTDFSNTNNYKNWFGFNSFRKVSTLADGSLVKTNLKISKKNISKKEAKFSSFKYKAKNKKFKYIHSYKKTDIKLENEYLNIFQKAEQLLNKQKNIYTISNRSIYELQRRNFEVQNKICKGYFNKLNKKYNKKCKNSNPDQYSFFILFLDDAYDLRRYLIKNNIFFPILWPKSTQENDLYGKILAIPLFDFSKESFFYFISLLDEYFKGK